MSLATTPPAAYRQGVFDTVQALSAGLEHLAHAERGDPCASDQAAQAARTIRSMGRTLAHLLERYPDTDLARLPAQAVMPAPPPAPVEFPR